MLDTVAGLSLLVQLQSECVYPGGARGMRHSYNPEERRVLQPEAIVGPWHPQIKDQVAWFSSQGRCGFVGEIVEFSGQAAWVKYCQEGRQGSFRARIPLRDLRFLRGPSTDPEAQFKIADVLL